MLQLVLQMVLQSGCDTMRAKNKQTKTVRRSVALPRELLEKVQACADPESRANVNRLVIVALQEFVENRKRRQFQDAMAQMVNDPQMRAVSEQISKEFMFVEMDGLASLDWE